ncbi:MAG: aminotransferase class V-fold PLP-dependent enzyme [Ruminococcaceae bacterium]|nr:aminotransferase class V-fold PLP-dependent enzyme [Oscillospiraceae bacterium]
MKRSSNYRHAPVQSRPNVPPPASAPLVYLDNAATSFPKPPEVVRETARALAEYGGNPGRGSHALSRRAAEKVGEARELAAQIFGASKPENVVFTHNATEALNMAIFSATKNGGHVLISDIEHNSVYRPVSKLASDGKIALEIYPSVGSSENIVRGIAERIRNDTVLVVACHKSNIVPITLPINEIGALCRDRGIKFVVDASQSAGNTDIDIKKCSAWAICAPGHKGLCGPQGVGLLVFGENARISEIEPFYFGGSGPSSFEREMPNVLPHRMEAGTLPTPAIAGLCEGMKYVIERTPSDIGRHESALVEYTKSELSKLPRVKIYMFSEKGAGVFLFNVDGISCQELAHYLDGRGICVRSGLHCAPLAHRRVGSYNSGGGVRVSFGPFSVRGDADRLILAIRELVIQK